MRPYDKTYPTHHGKQGDGTPARLFSNYDQSTVDVHFRMMADAGIDTAALQRFNPTGGEGPIRDDVTPKVARAAQASGRKWYCMYDASGWHTMQNEMKNDWQTKMREYADTPAYARQNGKPVVSIWGFGFNDDNHVWDPAVCLDVIHWFQQQGCYVIGGVPTWWRKGISDSRDNYAEVYRSFNMLSPWMVGRAGKIRDLDYMYREANIPDANECAKLGIDYQPCVMPGDLRAGDRRHGDFYWHHWYNMVRLLSTGVGLGIYISMFDEYNEGNQIAPTAETRAQQPPDFPHNALDEDGVACTSDYYLRITRDAAAMFKRLPGADLTPVRPTEPIPGKGAFNEPRPVGLRARANGRIVCAEGGGRSPLAPNRDNVGPWEKFMLHYPTRKGIEGGSSTVTIQACNGQYVCADPHIKGHDAYTLIANRKSAGPWETFEAIEQDPGVISFRAWNGKYVQAVGGGSGALVAHADDAGWWEQFEIVDD